MVARRLLELGDSRCASEASSWSRARDVHCDVHWTSNGGSQVADDFLDLLTQGRLKICLGMAAGVDVVVGVVETHGRTDTAAELAGLESVPRRRVEHRGAAIEEMDVEGILARRPAVVLVDEIAHTNAPGSRYTKRYEDVDVLLAAGVSVIGTLNLQHLESLHDVILRETGIDVAERVPDRILHRADQIIVIDLSPDELRRRIAQGQLYPPDEAEHALSGFFSADNLIALRRIALREVVEGIASIDESAVTGESSPVIREAGGDRSGVTGGTVVLSDRIVVGVTARPGESFLDRVIALVEGATRERTPNEIALTLVLSAFSLIFLIVIAPLWAMAWNAEQYMTAYVGSPVALKSLGTDASTLIALLVCLIPTTIGALLGAIGIAGIDRALEANILAKSGKAMEAAGDIDVILFDKTGTITIGNRRATAFLPVAPFTAARVARLAALASIEDATPEGKSIVDAFSKLGAAALEVPASAEFVFAARRARRRAARERAGDQSGATRSLRGPRYRSARRPPVVRARRPVRRSVALKFVSAFPARL
jgi:Osmosensitive K+ channel His kinase sensor domain/E1-E2 ATPase